jgi:hypothetical protein
MSKGLNQFEKDKAQIDSAIKMLITTMNRLGIAELDQQNGKLPLPVNGFMVGELPFKITVSLGKKRLSQ